MRRQLEDAEDRAVRLLAANRDRLEAMADALIAQRAFDAAEAGRWLDGVRPEPPDAEEAGGGAAAL